MVIDSIVLGTRNQGKILELRKLLEGFDIQIKGLDDFGPIPEVIEDGKTFEDNAYKKAYFTAKYLGLPAISDDSGLIVDALDGRPGVHSKRYVGDEAGDKERNSKLLKALEGIEKRSARFESVIAVAVPSGPALIYEGRCEGEISMEPKGENGFGFDPVFYYPPMKRTFAQLTTGEKNRVSHRGKAMRELQKEFDKVMIWIQQRMAEVPLGNDHGCVTEKE